MLGTCFGLDHGEILVIAGKAEGRLSHDIKHILTYLLHARKNSLKLLNDKTQTGD